MIRFKNNVLPVWFQWDGDEASLERAKQTIIDDIRMNGLDHYTGYADVMDEPTEEERQWDGSPTKETKPKASTASSKTTKKTKQKKADLPSGTPDMDKFVSEDTSNEVSTDFDTSKTAS